MMRHLVLGLLRFGGPLHGYALMKEYRDGSGRVISMGNLYRELQRLKASGLVRPATVPPAADPRRRPYEITPDGATAFDGWLAGPCRDGIGGFTDDEYALRAFFVMRAGAHFAPRVLGEWREELKAGRRALARVQEDSRGEHGRPVNPAAATRSLWLGRHLKHLETDLDFIASLESALSSAGSASGSS